MLKRRDAALTVALAVAGAAFGIGAEVAAGAMQGHALAVLDVAVGMLLLGFGATAHLRRPGSRTGVWLALAGLAWFAGTLGWPFVYLHRGFLALVLLSYPSGRLRKGSFVAVVVAARQQRVGGRGAAVHVEGDEHVPDHLVVELEVQPVPDVGGRRSPLLRGVTVVYYTDTTVN